MISQLFVPKGVAIVCIVLAGSISLAAQSVAKSKPVNSTSTLKTIPREIEPLSIGDVVPEVEFNMINYPSGTAKLADFKGKLVILDFWAIWCTSCLHSFPKLDSLQKQFGDKLQILLVNKKNTGEGKTDILDFFKKRKDKIVQLPSAVEDTVAEALFPHQLIPHCVWIGKDGTVRAITSSERVNAENIQTALDKADFNIPLKEDVDTEKPLFINSETALQKISHYSIFLKGRIDGLPINSFKRNGKIIYGRAIMNTPILKMYEQVIINLFRDYHFNPKRRILEVTDATKLVFGKAGDEYTDEELYTYELILPLQQAPNLYKYMLDDLNKYSGFYGRVEKRKVKCMVLVRTNSIDKIKTKGGKFEDKLFSDTKQFLKNGSIARLVLRLNNIENIKMPVIDGTGYKGNIDIELPGDFNKINELRKKLKQYNLDLIESERSIDMFVLTENKL